VSKMFVIQNNGTSQTSFFFEVKNEEETEQVTLVIPASFNGVPGISRELSEAEVKALQEDPKQKAFKVLCEQGVFLVVEKKPQVSPTKKAEELAQFDPQGPAGQEMIKKATEQALEGLVKKLEGLGLTPELLQQFGQFKAVFEEAKAILSKVEAAAKAVDTSAKEAAKSAAEAKKNKE